MRPGLVTALGLLGIAPTAVVGQNPHHQVDPKLFPGIKPNAKLQWHDCYEKFKCARLLVSSGLHRGPTVHHEAETAHQVPAKADCSKKHVAKTNVDTVALAIVKLPYVPGPSDPPRKGAVHVALGGWSASSTYFIVRFGEDYAPLFVGYDLVAIGTIALSARPRPAGEAEAGYTSTNVRKQTTVAGAGLPSLCDALPTRRSASNLPRPSLPSSAITTRRSRTAARGRKTSLAGARRTVGTWPSTWVLSPTLSITTRTRNKRKKRTCPSGAYHQAPMWA